MLFSVLQLFISTWMGKCYIALKVRTLRMGSKCQTQISDGIHTAEPAERWLLLSYPPLTFTSGLAAYFPKASLLHILAALIILSSDTCLPSHFFCLSSPSPSSLSLPLPSRVSILLPPPRILPQPAQEEFIAWIPSWGSHAVLCICIVGIHSAL